MEIGPKLYLFMIYYATNSIHFGNRIGDEGAKIVGMLLEINSSITSLNLSCKLELVFICQYKLNNPQLLTALDTKE